MVCNLYPLGISSLLILHLSAHTGCASQPQPTEPTAQALFIGGNTSAVYPGALDSKNRYSSTVALHINAKREDGSENCSGILVSPRDILTAGHCVCLRKTINTVAAKEQVARRLRGSCPLITDFS
jgi:hypothetical protein